MSSSRPKEELYGDLFSTERRAHLWNDLYDDPSNVFNRNMALRRDRICQLVTDRFSPDAEILDLGCGAGVVMEQLLQRGFRVTGADRSTDMLDLAGRRLEGFPPEEYQLHQGTCEDLPFEAEQFDSVLCVGVFGYIDDVVGALLEIRRVLRPGGLLLMSVRNPTNSLISDPIRVLRSVYREPWPKLWKILKSAASGSVSSASAESEPPPNPFSTRPPQFSIDILQKPRPLIRGVSRCGYRLDYFAGFGFGPLAVNGRSLLPGRLSVQINDVLNSSLDRLGLKTLTQRVGDVSIYGFIKSSD